MKICPLMSFQYNPVSMDDGYMECKEKDCQWWTGLDCAVKQIWLELSHRGIK